MAKWFVKDGNAERGPGTEEQLRAAFKKGALNATSQVRREDQTSWMALQDSGLIAPGEINPFLGSHQRNDSPAGASRRERTGDNSGTGVMHKGMFQEKPGYGARGPLVVASFVDRFAALLIDSFVLIAASVVFSRIPVLGLVINFIIGFAYFVFLQHEWGYTIGRKIMGIHVETVARAKPELKVFVIRYFAQTFSGLILCIGYFIALTNDKMRTLHDHVAGTLVVKD